jgi:mannose-6-phosphate isomerase-like protein (cupin superfamily)
MNGDKRNRWISIVIIVCMMLIGLPPQQAGAASEATKAVQAVQAVKTEQAAQAGQPTSDLSQHWAKEVMESWIESALLNGFGDQTYRPDSPVTRAEFAAFINRVFYFPDRSGKGHSFSDVAENAWYARDVAKLDAFGIVQGTGNGKFSPGNAISRQDAAVIMARAFHVSADGKTVPSFEDRESIADYAVASVAALQAQQYVRGNGGNLFQPRKSTTRAEVVQMIQNVMGTLIQQPGTYSSDVAGNLVINRSGVKLSQLTIAGDLYITQGVNDGEVTLEGVTVLGSTFILGGGDPGITLLNSTLAGPVRADKWNGQINIQVGEGSEIRELQLSAGGNVQLAASAKIGKLIIHAPAIVTGEGTIASALFLVSGSKLEKWPVEVEFASDSTATIEDELVAGDTRKKPTVVPNSGAGSGNGNGGTNPPDPDTLPAIVSAGTANADIAIGAEADDMMLYAAQELQETIKRVSGAELPIFKRDLSATVSVLFANRELTLTKSGHYPLEVHIVNNQSSPATIALTPIGSNDIPVNLPTQVSVGANERKIIRGSFEITDALADGSYGVEVQASMGGTALHTAELAVQYASNLLINPGFEQLSGTLPQGWHSPAGARDAAETKSGEHSMRIDLEGNPYMFARSEQELHLTPGKTYKLTAWVKATGPGTMNMEIHERQASGGSNPVTARAESALTTEWTLVELDYAPDAAAVYNFNNVYFFMSGTDSMWVDEVRLIEVDAEQGPAPEITTISSGNAVGKAEIVLATPETEPQLASQYADDYSFVAGSDGFAVRAAGNRIYILGDDSRGVLNGVYDFLEENADILWTRSVDSGMLYEPQSTILANKVNYAEKSPFLLRGWHTTGSGKYGEFHSDLDTEKMLARNKLNVKLAEMGNVQYWNRHNSVGITPLLLGHNLDSWLPNDKYFATHPEYYNEINGQYVPVSNDSQINFYHPDVPGVVASEIRALLAVQPLEYVGVGIMDNQVFSQGELSNLPFTTPDGLVVQPEDPAYKSTVFFTFLNKVAAELKLTHPDVKVTTFAYFFTDTPPKVELEDNIVIVMAPAAEDVREPFNTTDQNNANYGYKLKLEAWADATDNILMYNYYGCCATHVYERPIADKVQADMQYYRDLGILGVMPEGQVDNGDIWGINALQYWLIHQLYWNPDADLEALTDKFLTKAYGAAAEAMETYYDLIKQGYNYDQQSVNVYSRESQYIGRYVIQAGIADAAQAALDEAWDLANAEEKLRIAPIKSTFETMVFTVGQLPNLSAKAIKTSSSQAEIMNATDFQSGPWADAVAMSDFREMGTKQQVPEETNVYLLWDDENLYVGYENMDDDLASMVVSESAPGEWWKSGADDSVETYVTGNRDGTYYGFFSNPLAVKFEYKSFQDPTYNGEWYAEAHVGTDRWNAIQAIPFASIGVDPAQTSTLYGFFFRNFHGKERFITWGGGMVWNPGDFYPIHLEQSGNQANLVENPGFERGEEGSFADGWISTSAAWDHEEYYSGNYSLRLDLNGASYVFVRADQNIELEAGNRYKLSARVKGASTGSISMSLYGVAADGGVTMVANADAAANHQWQSMELEYEPAANATYEHYWVYIFMSGTDKLWIDDVALVDLTASPGTPEAGNLLDNPGFETATPNSFPDRWHSPTGVWDHEVSHGGGRSLRIERQGGEYALARSLQDFLLEPGKRYKLSAWVKGLTAGTASVSVNEMLAGGGSNPVTANADITLNGEWQLLELEYSPDINAVYDHNWIYFFMSGTDAMWLDDVTLTELPDAGR